MFPAPSATEGVQGSATQHGSKGDLMVLDRLPSTPNGKIDRVALPEPPAPTTTTAEEPVTDTGRRLVTI